ncbi:MAG: 6,7-dimethyl-8-ribityllumazine synthase [Alphaproteobacteria bacterium]|nr:6,7-dimethyl-8-ribityllumazine synthase [Alphaproteobacteria bacterium]
MKKILIIQATFYQHISKLLLAGATKKIAELGYEFEVLTVPGALEIPAAIAFAQELERYAGYVALGCVIRGETSHYDIVANESARGLNELAMKHKLAIGNGILTVENERQALERADQEQKDKGGFAANACAAMIRIREKF